MPITAKLCCKVIQLQIIPQTSQALETVFGTSLNGSDPLNKN